MSLLYKTFVFLLTVVIVAGCGTKPVRDIIIETKNKPITVPERLLRACNKSAPPNREEYIISNSERREELLVDYSINLISDIDKCNKQISEIATEQSKILEELK